MMHRYLHSYEDFLLVDEDYVARAGSRHAGGPRLRPPHKRWDSGNDENYRDFDDDDNEYDDYVEYDADSDDEYGNFGDRADWR